MLVYIAGKYRGDVAANIQAAREVAVELWEKGYVPICPHLNTAHFEAYCKVEDEVYLAGDLEIINVCDAVLFLPGWEESAGARGEHDYAFLKAKPVYYYPALPPKVAKVVLGAGKDAPMTVNENGGKQSQLDYDFPSIDPLVLLRLASIASEGSKKYGRWNWRRISLEENLNHALVHIFAHTAGDRQDDHLGHAFCRLAFALSLDITPGEHSIMKADA
jgi:hypothetical protein